MFKNFKQNISLLIIVCVLLVDQASKWLTVKHFTKTPEVIEVLPFFNLIFTINKGVSFGMFSGLPYGQYLLTALAFCIVIFIAILLIKEIYMPLKAGYAMIIAGATGNIIDRLTRGGVVDFLDFYIGNRHWPAFNIADSSIFLGVCLILFCEFRKKKPL